MAIAELFQSSADALFHSLVAIRQRRGPGLSEGELLDRVVDVFRSKGAAVARGSYIGDFIFDAVVQDAWPVPTAVGVASFDTEAEDWAGTERTSGALLVCGQSSPATTGIRNAGADQNQAPMPLA